MTHVCMEYEVPHCPLVEFVLKLTAHMTDADATDGKDALIHALLRFASAAEAGRHP